MVDRWPSTGPTTASSIELSGSRPQRRRRSSLSLLCIGRFLHREHVRSSKDGKAGARWTLALSGGLVPAGQREARCSNELLEHLEHLHETNDLFGNVAKSQSADALILGSVSLKCRDAAIFERQCSNIGIEY